MSESHLNEIRAALQGCGWEITERLRGEDGTIGAAAWHIQHPDGRSAVIDFDGFGCMGEDIPLEQSGGCSIRGRSGVSLYFRRINRRRNLWLADLSAFLAALNEPVAPHDV